MFSVFMVSSSLFISRSTRDDETREAISSPAIYFGGVRARNYAPRKRTNRERLCVRKWCFCHRRDRLPPLPRLLLESCTREPSRKVKHYKPCQWRESSSGTGETDISETGQLHARVSFFKGDGHGAARYAPRYAPARADASIAFRPLSAIAMYGSSLGCTFIPYVVERISEPAML